MITFLRKINRHIYYVLLGVVATFAMLSELLAMTYTTAYSSGASASTLIPWVVVFSVLIFGLISKLMIYLFYRISTAIFIRKSGLLYPFPIPFSEFETFSCAFIVLGGLLCGLAHLPVLFLPSLSRVLGAVRLFLLFSTLVGLIAFYLKKYAHDYDKKSLAYALILIPMIVLGLSLGLTIWEVVR